MCIITSSPLSLYISQCDWSHTWPTRWTFLVSQIVLSWSVNYNTSRNLYTVNRTIRQKMQMKHKRRRNSVALPSKTLKPVGVEQLKTLIKKTSKKSWPPPRLGKNPLTIKNKRRDHYNLIINSYCAWWWCFVSHYKEAKYKVYRVNCKNYLQAESFML